MSNIVELDVRPILDGGVDPFNAIMEKLKEINDDDTLLVINSFEPVPLLNLLKTKGYSYRVERPEQGVVYTYLTKNNKVEDNNNTEEKTDELSFEEIETKFTGKLKEIDVRDLEMPMPMVTILETLEQLNDGEALFVHHKRLPQYLLPELKNRDYKLVQKEIDDENIKLIIFK
jgi:uncharacterized protein (DUF2249 family)